MDLFITSARWIRSHYAMLCKDADKAHLFDLAGNCLPDRNDVLAHWRKR